MPTLLSARRHSVHYSLRRRPIQPREVMPATSATFGDLRAICQETWPPKTRPPGNALDSFGLGTAQRAASESRTYLVIGKGGSNWKRHNCNDESKDKKMCAHTMSLRRTKWRR